MVDPNPQIQTCVTKIVVYRYSVLRKTALDVSTTLNTLAINVIRSSRED